jgi:hypothetical protein
VAPQRLVLVLVVLVVVRSLLLLTPRSRDDDRRAVADVDKLVGRGRGAPGVAAGRGERELRGARVQDDDNRLRTAARATQHGGRASLVFERKAFGERRGGDRSLARAPFFAVRLRLYE